MTLSVPTQADVSLASIRQVEFAAAAGAAYFNHASDSPLPRRAARVMTERITLLENPLATVPAREEYLARAQQHLGRLIGGEPEQIAFLTNAADATSIVANGIDWRPGDEVIIVAGEFASFVYPWKALDRRGVEIKIVAKEGVATRYDDIVAAITPRTRLLAISHVEYQSGFRNDVAGLGALCRSHDLLFVVDASQSLGVLPVDASMNGVDVVVSVGYKWLMAPHGIGVLYVAPAAMERIAPSAPVPGRRAQLDRCLRACGIHRIARRDRPGASRQCVARGDGPNRRGSRRAAGQDHQRPARRTSFDHLDLHVRPGGGRRGVRGICARVRRR